MYPSHWGLTGSPFQTSSLAGRVYESESHDEALARLWFLVDNKRRLGLLLGEPGSGKSLTLKAFANELWQQGRSVAGIDCNALSDREFLFEALLALGAAPPKREQALALWRRLVDRLSENRCQGISSTLLLDNADLAAEESLRTIERLASLPDYDESGLTIILAAETGRAARLCPRLLDRVELKVDLARWSLDETSDYLQTSLDSAGCQGAIFSDAAAARLHELSGGLPRRVCRLADLSLLAGAGQNLERIDTGTIETVHLELNAAT